ncbi:MAG TPA: 50S ribosomal protein L11 methyltransferase [Solirubrobacteraceae bacterium]|nr:50S ribosomal protein L11 methyltransferase [Solirubrobacteraceae bacterium]
MIRLALRVRREDAEIALAELLELAPAGVEEVDVSADLVEYAVYGAPGELPALPALQAAVGGALVSVSTSEVADDWAERWREFHQPLRLGGRLEVRPPWRAAADTEINLVIDPGQAFGTGAHATTALCLAMLLELELPGGADRTVVDLGCGSGVLAILAARLGWGPVTALDYDPLAVEATQANAAVNGVALEAIERFDLRESDVPPARLVLANLLAPLLLLWGQRLAAAPTHRPETIIASGLLISECDRIRVSFATLGYKEIRHETRQEWAALLLSRRVG